MKKILTILLLLISTLAWAKKSQGHYPAIWVYNITKQEIVVARYQNETMPIASITKLMTAMVSLDYDRNLDRKIQMLPGGKLPAGEHTRRDIMTAMLVRSDNVAAESVARDYPNGRKDFIKAMNQKAKDIEMTGTRFFDPTGLSSSNEATAGSVGNMVQIASLYPFIVETSVRKHVLFEVNRKRKIRTISIDNTNKPLLMEFDQIKVSKTGFTNSAGWCVGMLVQSHGQEFVIVILHSESKQKRYELAKSTIYNQLVDHEVDNVINDNEPHPDPNTEPESIDKTIYRWYNKFWLSITGKS
jgi:serine-type D-Ala-D-Ala endopeptidase (penicillin-binding protein 7)